MTLRKIEAGSRGMPEKRFKLVPAPAGNASPTGNSTEKRDHCLKKTAANPNASPKGIASPDFQ
jgi:hypothetical protein